MMRPDAPSGTAVRRAVVGLVVSALAAFLVVGAGAVLAARSIAERTALTEGARAAQALGKVIFVPTLPDVMAGDAEARVRLDAAVLARQRDGEIVRVKVWTHDGLVLYSNEPKAMGLRFPTNSEVQETIDLQASTAALSDLTAPENVTERPGQRLVEVYTPLTLASGQRLALEVYSTDEGVAIARAKLTSTLVPFALLALLVLVLAQLPVSAWLLRRVGRADAERGRLLTNALTASERERRAIARELHDGVVQSLAGANFVLSSVRNAVASQAPPRLDMVEKASEAVRDAVGSLRTMMVDIYPPDLAGAGLPEALDQLAERLECEGVEVKTRIDLRTDLSSEVAAAAYRCARECTTNIAKHAAAEHAWIELDGDGQRLLVRVADDGRGYSAAPAEPGHLGLQLMRDAVVDLRGEFTIRAAPEGGTEVVIRLPVARR
ncbi:MAG TPA: histidine kinase [Kribbella sp.]